MYASSLIRAVIVVSVLTFVLNFFFGYFRARTKKFSVKWFLYIHLPIPFIFFARVHEGLDYRYIPLFIVAAVLGQIFGGKLGI